ncbi:O-antigen ligase family protein [Roseobacter sp. CCS2]|uniref:O-antigen ligase family protein n=1 Tax=Roseobacter sp. CCS2 TaxID=391593 RepID=UPI0000F40342|nr:O-antigen ligase family protein [Roseobacter sp. CCS2]EBA13725.1 hypothetical protein RCCS2_07549 [Roseobacter sp. CCS2]
MQKTTLFDPQRLLKTLCFIVLVFIPVNMLVSPVADFFTIEQRPANWTVTLSAFVFLLASMPLVAIALFFLKSRGEKLFLLGMAVFFIYAFSITLYLAGDLFYPMFGLTSVLGSTLVGVLFYVSIRDGIISPKLVFHVLAGASVLVVMPLLLVQIDPERYAQVAEKITTATGILYGYENPRAVGWASTSCLSLLAAYLSTQSKEIRINPIFLICAIICSTTLFWSGSRGGVVAFVVSLSIVFGLSQTKNYKGLALVLLCIVVGGAVSYFLHLPNHAYGMFSRIGQNLGQEGIDAISSGRIELWQTTLAHILERPFTGYGYLPHKSLEGFTHGSAHNIVLDSWLWFGFFIGTIVALFGIMFWVMAFLFFRKPNDPYVSALFCVITTLIVYCMFSGPYARTFPLLLFAISSGVIFGIRSAQADKQI